MISDIATSGYEAGRLSDSTAVRRSPSPPQGPRLLRWRPVRPVRPVRTVRLCSATLLFALVLTLIAGCSTAGSDAPAPAPSASKTATPTPDDEPSGTATRPPDALASDLPTVTRTGAPDTKATAGSASFSAPVTFADGVSVRITGVKQSTDTGKGPGVFTGSPVTQFSIELDNKSGKEIKLDQVVVTLLYGDPKRVASPVYQDGSKDLSGTVAAGQSTTAVYMYSVPTDQLSRVTMAVDFDGSHTAATFEGAVA